jgi:uncharacterized protein YkwD
LRTDIHTVKLKILSGMSLHSDPSVDTELDDDFDQITQYVPLQSQSHTNPNSLRRSVTSLRFVLVVGVFVVLGALATFILKTGSDSSDNGVENVKNYLSSSGLPSNVGWNTGMLNRLNAIRRAADQPALHLNSQLTKIAQAHSFDQWVHGHMSHTGSDGSSLGERVTRSDYSWSRVGENVARGQSSIAQVMQSWTNSPGHYRNMIGDFTEVGFGHENGFWTQVFAAPLQRHAKLTDQAYVPGDDIDVTGSDNTLVDTKLDDRWRLDMLQQLNVIRLNATQPAIRMNSMLAQCAQGHSIDQSLNGHMSHTGSNGSTVGTRVTLAGYQWAVVGECVAHGPTSVTDVMRDWSNSTIHMKIMTGDFHEVGFGFENGYWTQVFAR